MRIYEPETRTPEFTTRLTEIWERSVRATHLFLSNSEVEIIKAYVPQALNDGPGLVIAEEHPGIPAGFMGVDGQKLEMLFLSPEARGKGLGRKLFQYGMDRYGVSELAVNEQNPQARGFCEHMGFRVYKRTETDEQGGPYPLLYMKL